MISLCDLAGGFFYRELATCWNKIYTPYPVWWTVEASGKSRLAILIKALHRQSRPKVADPERSRENCGEKIVVNHKSVERIMRKEWIRSKLAKKFKATTKSKHNLPVAQNLLNREFTASKPGEKMVSDIAYVWIGEGWLYVAPIIDLCGKKIVGLSDSGKPFS